MTLPRWTPTSERLPRVGQQWDGETFVVAFYQRQDAPPIVVAMTSMYLVNVVKHGAGDGRPVPTHWLALPGLPGKEGPP